MTRRVNRRGGAPRNLLVLLGVTIVVVGAAVLLLQDREPDYTTGGRLFPVAAEDIEGMVLTRQGLQHRFDRNEDGFWSLSGATSDYLDAQAMSALLRDLAGAGGGALLPGTEPEDRRFEFNGPDALRLRVFASGGREMALAVGTANPVTGNHFASGAGRVACFPVTAGLRERLAALPGSVQGRTLLPEFDPAGLTSIVLDRGPHRHEFARRGGRWWLRLDPAQRATSLAALPRSVTTYEEIYSDRRREDASGRWILASDDGLGRLVNEVSTTIVRDVLDPRRSAGRLDGWDLDPPWRRIVMSGPGVNPDPSAPSPDRFELAFGLLQDGEQVPALRRGNVVMTDPLATEALNEDLGLLVEQNALGEIARHADTVSVLREGAVVLEAGRTGQAETAEGRMAWRTTLPEAGRPGLDETARHGLAQDLVVNINRLPILAVLPPTDDRAVLRDRERVRVRLAWTGERSRDLVVECGVLDTSRLPAGAGSLGLTEVGAEPVGLWFPATGKLLQVPDYLVVTGRTMARLAGVLGE